MPRPIQAQIRLQAFRHNLNVARQHIALGRAPEAKLAHTKLWAVVKANAYGHGLLKTWPALEDADGLAVVEFNQAERLRQAGFKGPLLMLEGAFDGHDIRLAMERQLSLVVHCQEQLDALESFWRSLAHQQALAPRINLFLKFNSGMNRLGFQHAGFRKAREQARRLPWTGELTLMTHFADADVPQGSAQAIERFQAACAGFDEPISMANSAATLSLPKTHGAWVRPGVMLYGATPFSPADPHQTARSIGLQPAMTLSSELIAVQNLQPGDTVGYGSSFRAEKAMRIGVVACGYADGYPRHAPTGTPIMVMGTRTRTLGRVAMDMMMVDLSAIPQAQLGSSVELWGEQVSVDEVAGYAGTIGYELLCALASRVPVQYLE